MGLRRRRDRERRLPDHRGLGGHRDENQLYYLDLRDPDAEVVKLFDDFSNSYEFVGHNDDVFYLVTNHEAPKQRLVAVDTGNPHPDEWFELIPESDLPLQGLSMINGNEFVGTYMKDAHTVVYRFDIHGNQIGEIELPGIGSAGGFGGHREDTEASTPSRRSSTRRPSSSTTTPPARAPSSASPRST